MFTTLGVMTETHPISGLYDNVEPLIVKRGFGEFPHFCNVFIVNRSNPSYERLMKMLKMLTDKEKRGNRLEIDLTSNIDLNVLNKKNYYIIDVRKERDNTIESISIKNIDKTDRFSYELVCNEILDRTRGVWFFADRVEDVPNVLLTRCQWSLSEETSDKLHQFIFKAGSKTTRPANPVKIEDKLYGVMNTDKWNKIVEF